MAQNFAQRAAQYLRPANVRSVFIKPDVVTKAKPVIKKPYTIVETFQPTSEASFTGARSFGGPFGGMKRGYEQALLKYPKLTNGITCGFLGGFADCVAQGIQYQRTVGDETLAVVEQKFDEEGNVIEEIVVAGSGPTFWEFMDKDRLAAFSIFNMFFSATAADKWFKFLGNQKALTVVGKLGVTQLGYVPFIYLPSFYVTYGFMMGLEPEAIWQKVKTEVPNIVKISLVLWSPVFAVQYMWVPVRHHVLYTASSSVFWNIMMSKISGGVRNVAVGATSATSAATSAASKGSAAVVASAKTTGATTAGAAAGTQLERAAIMEA